MSGTSKRSNDDKTKGSMDNTASSTNNPNMVSNPNSLLQEMSRSNFVPGYPAPGSFPGFHGRAWQDLPPFLLRGFMPPVPLGMDMLSTALLHSLQGSSIYPSPTNLPMMRSQMGLMQPPFNAPIFTNNDTLRSSPLSKSHKQDSKQRISKRTPSETNIYAQTMEQLVTQKNKDVHDNSKRYSPIRYNSPRTKSNKSVEESIIIPGDDEPLDVIKIPDDNNSPLALVTKKMPQSEIEENLPQTSNCQNDPTQISLQPLQSLPRDLDRESCASRKSSTPIQAEERPSSKPGGVRMDFIGDQLLSEQDIPEQRNVPEDPAATNSKHSIALPPRKRLTRNTEDMADVPTSSSVSSLPFLSQPAVALQSTVLPCSTQPSTSSTMSMSFSDSPQSSNFRSCWKKFSAKITNHCQPVHRSYHAAGKPMYDCRAIFQKLSSKDAYKPGVLMGKPYLSGRFHHRARYTPRKEPQVQEGSSSPRITRSQARQKKVNAEESGTNAQTEPQEVTPVRKSLRKKTSNSKYDAPDIVTPGTKTRKPRNSKKNQEESKMSGDSLNDSSTLNSAEKPSDDILDQNKSKKDEPSTSQDPSSSSDRTPDKSVADDLPQQLTPAIPTSLEDSKTEKRLDSCDRKSTSSGLSTCSGDVSFDPEFPISLPPKFRHTKRKPAFLNFSVDDKSSEATVPTLVTSIHLEVQASVCSATSTSCSAPTVTTPPVTSCDTLVSSAITTTNNVVSVSEPATRLEIAQPSKIESTTLTTTAPVEPLVEPDDNDTTDEKPIAPSSPVIIQREIPIKTDISSSPHEDQNVQHVTKVAEPDKFSTASHASLGEQKPAGQTKITLKFESDTISTLISTSQLSEVAPSVHVNNFSTCKSESSKRLNYVKPHENVPEFRLKIDLTELNKKTDEQMKRPVMVLMPENLKMQDVTKHHHHHHDIQMDVNNQQIETAKSESCPSSFKSSEGFSCTRKVEIPGSSKIKTISVLLRSRADVETIKSSTANIDVPPSEHTSQSILQEETIATDATAQEESFINQDQSLCKTSKADKKKKKGKGMKKKRQKRKQSTDGRSGVGIDENSISPCAPIIVRAKESSSSLNGNQSSNSPPQLEMASQLTYADHFSDISDSEVNRMRMNEGKQTEAAIKIGIQDVIQPVASSSECNADQKGGLFISRKRKRSSTSNSAQVSVSIPVINPNVSAEPNVSPVESTVSASLSTSSISNANFGGHSSRRHEGKSVDIYDWNANNDCDTNDLDDIMRIRQNRLANRLMSTTGQSSSSSTPLKKRFLPTDNQPPSFDNLLSTCKSVSVVVQKLEKDGQETCENNTPALASDSNISPAKANGTKKKRKKGKQGKQENKKVKKTATLLDNISTPINISYAKPLTQVANSLSCCGPIIPISSTPNISPVSSSSLSRETRIPPSIRLPHPVISNMVNPQPQMSFPMTTEVKPLSQNGKVIKSIKSDRQLSEPVKFKLKKIGRQWISVNEKDKLEDSMHVTPRKDKDKKKAQKDLPAKKSSKLMSIFMPDSLTHGFVCNDKHLQQAFTEKILISEFFKKTFDDPPHSGVLDISPNVSFKFVFDDKTDECEVSLLVDPKDVFFVPAELELLMSALTINDDEKIPESREPLTTKPQLVRPCQVTSLDDVHLLVRPEVKKSVIGEGGKTILEMGGMGHSTSVSEYNKKDELLGVLQVDEDAQNFDEFKMQARTPKHPLLYVPLFDDVSTLENADDPWDIFGYPMINVIM